MKANEFVKSFGWKEAKKKNSEGDNFYVWRRDKELFKDLKRLVESHDLVENHNGVDMAKRFIDANIECNDSDRLKQAIADVESCMEGL